MHAPESWNDLLDPRYKNNLQMADARTSGTATERIYSLVKVMGEDPAFAYTEEVKRQYPDVHKERCRWCNAYRYRPVRLRLSSTID